MMKNDFIVRKARPADFPALVSLLEELFRMETDFAVDPEKQLNGLRLLHERKEAAIIFTAQWGQEVVGMATGQTVVSTAEGGISVRVEDVVVDPAFRGRGIGKKMLDAMKVWAVTHGAKRMELLADRTNGRALEFYERLGWQSSRMVCRYYRLKE